MRTSLTNGTVIIYADICECGLTGGCNKCQPITIPYIIPYQDNRYTHIKTTDIP